MAVKLQAVFVSRPPAVAPLGYLFTRTDKIDEPGVKRCRHDYPQHQLRQVGRIGEA
jgi:hypothetical protein